MKKSHSERMEEFVDYHIHGDGEANGIILKEIARRRNMSEQEIFDLSYFYATTYCIVTALLMMEEKDEILSNPEAYAEKNLKRFIFQSDRRYTRVNGNFARMLRYYADHLTSANQFREKVTANGRISLRKALNEVQGWYFFGRFGAYLFTETWCMLIGRIPDNTKFDWENGDTATSGMLNLYGLDKSADYFDKHDKLPPNISTKQMDNMLERLLFQIKKRGGSTNITEVETSLCAYRKFYKGSRYNGYYLDRILEELIKYEKQGDGLNYIAEIYEIRKEKFNPGYLGEIGGWKGVRPECKTLYKRMGIMM